MQWCSKSANKCINVDRQALPKKSGKYFTGALCRRLTIPIRIKKIASKLLSQYDVANI